MFHRLPKRDPGRGRLRCVDIATIPRQTPLPAGGQPGRLRAPAQILTWCWFMIHNWSSQLSNSDQEPGVDVHEVLAVALQVKSWMPRVAPASSSGRVAPCRAACRTRHHFLLAEHAYQARFRRWHPVVANSVSGSDIDRACLAISASAT